MKSIGIMGGTFNPIHMGHLLAAEEVKNKICLDKILFIPTGNPPHKRIEDLLLPRHRLEMVKLAIEGNANFLACDIEIAREGKTYSYDTLKELHNLYENYIFHFIIGYDTLKEIGTWKNIEELCKLCSFIVVNRNNKNEEMQDEIQKKIKGYNAKIQIVDIPNIEISSTDIRERLMQGRAIKYLVPDNVEKYIYNNTLYNWQGK
jgi:nicotinate-nucleotide adenylyltransferase